MSLAQAGREYGVRDAVISRWKQEFVERSPQVFKRGQERDERDQRSAELEISRKVSSILNSR